MRESAGGAPGLGFLSPFGHRPSLLGHPFPAGGLGLPCGRLTGTRQCRTPTGFPCCAPMRCGRSGCPLYPGDNGARANGCVRPLAVCHLPAAASLHPGPAPIAGACIDEASSRVHMLHPPGLPLACAPSDGTQSLGLLSELHTPPSPATHVEDRDRSWALTRTTSSWFHALRSL